MKAPNSADAERITEPLLQALLQPRSVYGLAKALGAYDQDVKNVLYALRTLGIVIDLHGHKATLHVMHSFGLNARQHPTGLMRQHENTGFAGVRQYDVQSIFVWHLRSSAVQVQESIMNQCRGTAERIPSLPLHTCCPPL